MDKKLERLLDKAIRFGVISPRTVNPKQDQIYMEILETLNTSR